MGQAAALGLWELSGGGWENYARFITSYRRVTAADIQRVATKYLQRRENAGEFPTLTDQGEEKAYPSAPPPQRSVASATRSSKAVETALTATHGGCGCGGFNEDRR